MIESAAMSFILGILIAVGVLGPLIAYKIGHHNGYMKAWESARKK
jgi:hypothetical protein